MVVSENFEDPTGNLLARNTEQKEEIQAVITRAEVYLKHSKMIQDVLRSQEALLYNRINKQDTQSMKTIAVATLVFLPGTFVSAIFSTGIFNFQASEPPNEPKTISKYGWIYLLSCILSTIITLVAWLGWYCWGRTWLEKLEFHNIGKPKVEDGQLPFSRYHRNPSRHISISS